MKKLVAGFAAAGLLISLAACVSARDFSSEADQGATCAELLGASPEEQKTVAGGSPVNFLMSGSEPTTNRKYILSACEGADPATLIRTVREQLAEDQDEFGSCVNFVTLDEATRATWVGGAIAFGARFGNFYPVPEDPAVFAALVPLVDGFCADSPEGDLAAFAGGDGRLTVFVNDASAAGDISADALSSRIAELGQQRASAAALMKQVTIETSQGYSFELSLVDVDIDVVADVAGAPPGQATLKWGSKYTVEVLNTTPGHDAPGFSVRASVVYPAEGELCSAIGAHPRIFSSSSVCGYSIGGVDFALEDVAVGGTFSKSLDYPTEGGLVDVPEGDSARLVELARQSATRLTLVFAPDIFGEVQCTAGDCDSVEVLS